MAHYTILAFIITLLSLSVSLANAASSGGSYPRCVRTGRRTGMAHYRGWKVIGDDVSPPSCLLGMFGLTNEVSDELTTTSERSCIQACIKHGNSTYQTHLELTIGCSGISYSDTLSLCYLKGDDHAKWTYERSMNRNDGVDLIGGCSTWSGIGQSSHVQWQ
jgi:hypothetical protein